MDSVRAWVKSSVKVLIWESVIVRIGCSFSPLVRDSVIAWVGSSDKA